MSGNQQQWQPRPPGGVAAQSAGPPGTNCLPSHATVSKLLGTKYRQYSYYEIYSACTVRMPDTSCTALQFSLDHQHVKWLHAAVQRLYCVASACL